MITYYQNVFLLLTTTAVNVCSQYLLQEYAPDHGNYEPVKYSSSFGDKLSGDFKHQLERRDDSYVTGQSERNLKLEQYSFDGREPSYNRVRIGGLSEKENRNKRVERETKNSRYASSTPSSKNIPNERRNDRNILKPDQITTNSSSNSLHRIKKEQTSNSSPRRIVKKQNYGESYIVQPTDVKQINYLSPNNNPFSINVQSNDERFMHQLSSLQPQQFIQASPQLFYPSSTPKPFTKQIQQQTQNSNEQGQLFINVPDNDDYQEPPKRVEEAFALIHNQPQTKNRLENIQRYQNVRYQPESEIKTQIGDVKYINYGYRHQNQPTSNQYQQLGQHEQSNVDNQQEEIDSGYNQQSRQQQHDNIRNQQQEINSQYNQPNSNQYQQLGQHEQGNVDYQQEEIDSGNNQQLRQQQHDNIRNQQQEINSQYNQQPQYASNQFQREQILVNYNQQPQYQQSNVDYNHQNHQPVYVTNQYQQVQPNIGYNQQQNYRPNQFQTNEQVDPKNILSSQHDYPVVLVHVDGKLGLPFYPTSEDIFHRPPADKEFGYEGIPLVKTQETTKISDNNNIRHEVYKNHYGYDDSEDQPSNQRKLYTGLTFHASGRNLYDGKTPSLKYPPIRRGDVIWQGGDVITDPQEVLVRQLNETCAYIQFNETSQGTEDGTKYNIWNAGDYSAQREEEELIRSVNITCENYTTDALSNFTSGYTIIDYCSQCVYNNSDFDYNDYNQGYQNVPEQNDNYYQQNPAGNYEYFDLGETNDGRLENGEIAGFYKRKRNVRNETKAE